MIFLWNYSQVNTEAETVAGLCPLPMLVIFSCSETARYPR